MGRDDLKAAAKEFFVDVFLEFNRGEVIDTLKKILAPFSPDDMKQFASEGTAPPIPEAVVEHLKGYEDYLEKLKPEEVFQWMFEARPDLAEALMSLGDEGASYMIKLQSFIVESVKTSGKAETKQPETQMVNLHCESCGGGIGNCPRTWPSRFNRRRILNLTIKKTSDRLRRGADAERCWPFCLGGRVSKKIKVSPCSF